MSNFWVMFATHWKSTAKGILILVITTCGVLLANPQTLNGKASALVALVAALATAYLGLISKDAGVEYAIPQGKTEPVAVSSHETPDKPATVVK